MTAGALVLSVGALGACHKGGPEGKYSLDKAEMKKQMAAEVAKLPKEQQALAGLATAMIDMMDMQLELQSGGKLQATSKMPSMDKNTPAKTESKSGTWKKDGDKLVLTIDGKPLSCDQTKTGLSCKADKPHDPPMVFIKAS